MTTKTEEKLKQVLTEQYGRNIREYYQDNSAYLVLHRSVLEEMPEDWQKNFIGLIEQIQNVFDVSELPDHFQVQLRDKAGKFITDQYINRTPQKYRRHDD